MGMAPTIEQDSSEKQRMTSAQTAFQTIQEELRKAEQREKELKDSLRKNLNRFGQVAIMSSYVKLINEQLTYMDILLKNAKEDRELDVVKTIQDQIAVIAALKATVEANS